MSFSIAIGSDIEHLDYINKTVHFLKYLSDNMKDNAVIFTHDTSYAKSDLDNLIDWYTGINAILTDPSMFASEMLN